MVDEDSKDKGFKVEDKRRFTTEGETKAPVSEEPEAKKPIPLPPIDFNSFVLSLASSVQVHLGLLPDPVEGKTSKSLDLAKQTIDVLGILAQKTKGNLTQTEDKLLQEVLHTVRLQFVEASK